MNNQHFFTRREFIKAGIGLLGGVYLSMPSKATAFVDIPTTEKIGRIAIGGDGARFDLKAKPDFYSNSVGLVYHDDLIPWYREVAASSLDLNSINQRWVETEGGYIYAGYVQPVKNLPNATINELPVYGETPGVWVEITVPLADLKLDGPPGSYWLKNTYYPRVYYGQVYWADKISKDETGKVYYRMTQRVGCQEEYYWVSGDACKIITPEDIAPIRQEVTDKKVVVNLKYQTLSCIENGQEVYFCRISSGPKTSEGWATTPGDHTIWRKCVSMHMSANGSTGEAFDTPGIGWATLFTTNGAAIHSAFWHNEFGFARSHGCVNCLPEDAKFVWRWTTPIVQYDPGDLIWKDWQSGYTPIIVKVS